MPTNYPIHLLMENLEKYKSASIKMRNQTNICRRHHNNYSKSFYAHVRCHKMFMATIDPQILILISLWSFNIFHVVKLKSSWFRVLNRCQVRWLCYRQWTTVWAAVNNFWNKKIWIEENSKSEFFLYKPISKNGNYLYSI